VVDHPTIYDIQKSRINLLRPLASIRKRSSPHQGKPGNLHCHRRRFLPHSSYNRKSKLRRYLGTSRSAEQPQFHHLHQLHRLLPRHQARLDLAMLSSNHLIFTVSIERTVKRNMADYVDDYGFVMRTETVVIPHTLHEAKQSPLWRKWQKAIRRELEVHTM
jgi:hypothetical protein